MGWDPAVVPDPQAESTFRHSKLRWQELDEPAHRRLFDFYRSLIAARREHPELLHPGFATAVDLADDGDVQMDRGAPTGWGGRRRELLRRSRTTSRAGRRDRLHGPPRGNASARKWSFPVDRRSCH